MAIRILSSENIKGQLNVKDTQDTVFDSGLSVTRSLTTQTGYINIVGGAFNFNAPASISTKFRSNGNELIRIESDGDFWLRQVGKKLYFQNSAGSAPYIKNSGEDASTTPYGRNLEFYTDSYKRIEIDYAGTTTFDSGSNNVVAVFKSTDAETQVNFVDSTGFASIRSRNDFRFYVGGSSLIRAMDIADDGNVGIGITTPSGNLSMNSQIGNGTNPPTSYAANTAATRYQSFFNSYYVGATDQSGPYPRYFDMVATGSPDGTNGGSNIRFFTTGVIAATGAESRMIITSAGNVGIGTDSPGATLEVEGGTNAIIKMNSTSGTGGRMDFAHGGSIYGNIGSARNILGTGNAADMMVNADSLLILGVGSQDMTIRPSGNIGIGTTSPANKIQTKYSPVAIGNLTASNDASSTTNFNVNAGLLIEDSNTSNGLALGVSGQANDRKSWIQSGHPTSLYGANLGIISLNPLGGNVGIGTTSPNAKLEITGTAEQRYLQVDAIAGFAGIGSTMDAMVEFDNAGDGNNVTIKTNNSARTDAAPFSVWTEANSRFLILNNGNVGIGTSSPDQLLEVAGGLKISQGNSRLYFGAANGTDRRALEGNTSGSLLQIGESYTDIALQGNVGIGTTGPSSILTVYGGGSTTSTLELRGGATGADNATISTQQSMAFQIGSAGATGRSYTFLSGGLGYGSGTALFSIDSNGGTFNRLWPQTTTSGSSSVVQTTLIPEPGIYEYYLQGNPNNFGSGSYTSLQAGLITIAVDYTVAKSVFLRIIRTVTAQDGGGSSNIQLNLNVYMLYNGSASGEQSIGNKDQSVIYLTVSGYAGTAGSGQILRLTRKV